MPDPVIGDDHHYLPFEEVFGTDTTEKDRVFTEIKRWRKEIYTEACKKCKYDADADADV